MQYALLKDLDQNYLSLYLLYINLISLADTLPEKSVG